MSSNGLTQGSSFTSGDDGFLKKKKNLTITLIFGGGDLLIFYFNPLKTFTK